MYTSEIICLTLVVYLSIIYFGAKRTKTYQHKLFVCMLALTYVNLLSELIMSNHLPVRDGMVDKVMDASRTINYSNGFYVFTMFAFYYVTFLYVRYLATGETIEMMRKNIKSGIPVLLFFCGLFLVPLIVRRKLILDEVWEFGAILTPVVSLCYMVAAGFFLFEYHNQIEKKKLMAIILAIVGQLGVAVLQGVFTEDKISSLGFILMDFTFYLTVESPDALLIERLEYEKERADEANNAKSAFLANMSHEIRTPMNAVVGMTEILLRTDLTDQQRSYLYNIKHSGNSLLLIINDLLDFSKIEAGKMELVNDNYDPMSLFNDVSMIILNRIGDKPVELIYDVDPALPAKMYGDMGRIKQIIINLMNNAVKFTEEGYVKLSAKVSAKVGRTYTIEFTVEDSGQGIKEEDVGKLFDAFKQVDMQRNRKKEGTGLGLSISKQLVNMMGGDISVTSEYGKGSCFSFSIKQKVVNDNPAVKIKDEVYEIEKPILGGCLCSHESILLQKLAQDFGFSYDAVTLDDLETTSVNHLFVDEGIYRDNKEELSEYVQRGGTVAVLYDPMKNTYADSNFEFIGRPFYSYSFGNFMNHESGVIEYKETDNEICFSAPDAKILLVDDTDMNLKVAIGLLSPLGMKIDVARSGKEAIEKTKNTKYHIVFMDHMMPGMDGVEAIGHIRKLTEFDNYYADSPIVALTANVAGDAKEAFSTVGVKDYVSKPIDIKQISRVIKNNLPEELVGKQERCVELSPIQKAALLPVIKGLNVIEGVKNSGNRELFENLLGDFYKLIDMKSTKIEKCLNDGMYHDFTIEVHALKNTARMIGALELSEKFKKLEELGHEEKADEIMKLVPEVLEQFKSYKAILLPYANSNVDNKEEVPKETILEALNDIRDGIDTFDLDKADEAMSRLEGYKLSEGAEPLLENLRAYIADVAMEEVMQTVDNLIDFVNLS